ncbi:hypothetical protein AVEN_149565-1, partial [Araneus ventricosus]
MLYVALCYYHVLRPGIAHLTYVVPASLFQAAPTADAATASEAAVERRQQRELGELRPAPPPARRQPLHERLRLIDRRRRIQAP